MNSAATFRHVRELPHPPAAVFAAFADPALLAAWWGPEGFTNEFETFEFEHGGAWIFTMIGPDGARYPNRNVFRQIIVPQRLVVRHDCAPYFTLTMELAATPTGTRLDWSAVFDDAAWAGKMRPILEPANEQNLDRLARVLARAAG